MRATSTKHYNNHDHHRHAQVAHGLSQQGYGRTLGGREDTYRRTAGDKVSRYHSYLVVLLCATRFDGGPWGVACGDGWGVREAMVACRQLGLRLNTFMVDFCWARALIKLQPWHH